MEDREKTSAHSPPSESPLTREELLRKGSTAAVAIGLSGALAGTAVASPARRRRRFATPSDTLVVAVEGDIDTFDPGSPSAPRPRRPRSRTPSTS